MHYRVDQSNRNQVCGYDTAKETKVKQQLAKKVGLMVNSEFVQATVIITASLIPLQRKSVISSDIMCIPSLIPITHPMYAGNRNIFGIQAHGVSCGRRR